MKALKLFPLTFYFVLIAANQLLHAQCAIATAVMGSSTNMFTLKINGTNPIVADKNLNTIILTHANNAGTFGGSQGHLRYDISTNGGSGWLSNQGVLNPLFTAQARYPNVLIHNPSGNTDPANAYLAYISATFTGSSPAGLVNGAKQLIGFGSTENYNQPATSQTYIPQSAIKGAQDVFWAVDEVYSGTSANGFRIYKGVWNGTNDLVWSTNFTINPSFNTSFDGNPHIGNYTIAFDPTGTNGWMCFLGHLSTDTTGFTLHPVFYKTTDAGNNWSGPYSVDLNKFSCITGNISAGYRPSTSFEHDLTVDINGNPHLLTTICNATNDYNVSYNLWHHMFDITQVGGVWNAIDIANVNAGSGSWGVVPNNAVMHMAPQIARTADGKKVFFCWTDNAAYNPGDANQSPNLMSKAFDVVNQTWTGVKDFTSCNAFANGKIIFPRVAAEVLEPSATTFKIAAAYGILTANDPALTANFRFLDNLLFNETDFSIAQPSAAINILEGDSIILGCGSVAGVLNIGGGFSEALWSDGTMGSQMPLPSDSAAVYTVVAQSACLIGRDTATAYLMNVILNDTLFSVCFGDSVNLSASGNAVSYTWLPGGQTNPSIFVSPSTSTTYTLLAHGTNSDCNFFPAINVNALPAVSYTASATQVCAGSAVNLAGNGALNYTWTGGINNAVDFYPLSAFTYVVTGTDSNMCSDTASVYIDVISLPDTSVIQSGIDLTAALAGASYQWFDCLNNMALTGDTLQSFTAPSNGEYALIITQNGCVDTSSCYAIISVGLADDFYPENELSIFPNPSSGSFVVKSVMEGNFEIVNELGEVLVSFRIGKQQNSSYMVEGLREGIYFVRSVNAKEVVCKKLVVIK